MHAIISEFTVIDDYIILYQQHFSNVCHNSNMRKLTLQYKQRFGKYS